MNHERRIHTKLYNMSRLKSYHTGIFRGGEFQSFMKIGNILESLE